MVALLRCGMSATRDTRWEVSFDGDTLTVELPADLELDEETGAAINEEFVRTLERENVRNTLTLLRVENPLSSGVFDAVQAAADAAVDNGVSKWAVVVERKVKGMAFQSKLSGVETGVFEDEAEARAFLA